MSSISKIGLGYCNKSNAEVLGYEEEMSRGIFVLRETDAGYYDIPLYSRFKQVEYKGVPHPLSGDYTPREQEDIDDSLYEYGKFGPQPQSPSPTVSETSSTVYSTCPSNDSDGEQGAVSDHSVNDDPSHDHIPIPSIEQVTIATQKTQPQVPKPQQTVDPSCAQHVKTPRQPIRTPVTPSPIPSYNRQNWNQRMERDLGTRVVHAMLGQATPVWTNTSRVNKANQFTPRPVQLSNIRPNLSTASKTIKTGRVNVNTGHGHVNTGKQHVTSGTQFKSGASRFNTGKQHVNSGSVHVNSGTQIKSGASRFNTGKQHVNSGSVRVNSGTQIKSGASRFNTGKQHVNSGSVHVNSARVNRPVSNNTSPNPSQVNLQSPKKCFSKQRSPVNRLFSRNTAHKSNKYAVKGQMGTAVKTSAGCVWRQVIPLSNTNSGPTPDSNVNDHPLKHMEHRGIFDSGCSGHMTGNKAHLDDYQELSKVGSVTFGGSKGFAEIVDFLRGSNLRYALTANPTIYDSLVKQFWQSAIANTKADGSLEINATIDTHLSSKSGGWDQFGSNIATALICLSTGRVYNFSKLVFECEVSQEVKKVGRVYEKEEFGFDRLEEEEMWSGRKSQDDPPLDSSVSRTGYSSTLKLLFKVKRHWTGRRYKRRKEDYRKDGSIKLGFSEEVDAGAEQVNTASAEQVSTAEGVNTGSIKLSTANEQVSTVGTKESTSSQDKGQREGKAPMLSEETPKKSKEQILQEEASLAEAIRLDTLQKEKVAKEVHLDSLLAQRIAEEEELNEQQKKRKAQVQFEAQHYTNECWGFDLEQVEANAECQKGMLEVNFIGEDFARKWLILWNQEDNQGTWKLSQLKKLSFEEVKEEFDKLVKQVESFAPISFEATKANDEPTRKSGRRKQMERKGMHTSVDKNDSEDSDEVGEHEESTTGTETPINLVPVAMKTPSIGMDGPEDKLEKDFGNKYPLSAEVCQTMLKMKLLDGKMNEDCYRMLKMMEKQAGLASPRANALGKILKFVLWLTNLQIGAKGLTSPEQTATGKGISNPLMAVMVCQKPYGIQLTNVLSYCDGEGDDVVVVVTMGWWGVRLGGGVRMEWSGDGDRLEMVWMMMTAAADGRRGFRGWPEVGRNWSHFIFDSYLHVEQAPPSLNYVLGLEHPPSPDYMPGPEHPPSLDYVPGPEYPEYLVPSDDEEDPEEDPADGRDDADEEEEEEDEHLRQTSLHPHHHHLDFAGLGYLPTPDTDIPSPQLSLPSPPTHTNPTYAEAPLGYRAAMIRLSAASPLPLPAPSSLLLLPATDRKEDVLEADVPPQNRLCLTAPASRFEVGESSAAAAARQPGLDVTHATDYSLVDVVDATPGHPIAPTTLEELSQRVTDLAATLARDTHEMYVRFEDSQDDRALHRARVNTLFRDRRYHPHTAMLLESEARYARHAWSQAMDCNRAVHAELLAYRAEVRALQEQIGVLQRQIQQGDDRTR
ncbi:hypothetical protein Tco_0770308 [Tanacetum coccineum]|uniref:Uncharacterized protein n=1 Tax=Tanacetum coccineum TaxID=301880 RepID=A0ABQ4ZFG2_9ASTR